MSSARPETTGSSSCGLKNVLVSNASRNRVAIASKTEKRYSPVPAIKMRPRHVLDHQQQHICLSKKKST